MSYKTDTPTRRIMRFVLGSVNKDVWNWEPNYSFLSKPDKIHTIKLPEHGK